MSGEVHRDARLIAYCKVLHDWSLRPLLSLGDRVEAKTRMELESFKQVNCLESRNPSRDVSGVPKPRKIPDWRLDNEGNGKPTVRAAVSQNFYKTY